MIYLRFPSRLKLIAWPMISVLALCVSLACSRPEVGAFLPNHPWMVHEYAFNGGVVYSDIKNSDVVYLVPFNEGGKADKIDLQTKTVVPWKFETNEGDPKITMKYRPFPIQDDEKDIIFRKFQGTMETRTIKQDFGWPGKEYQGTRKVIYYTGQWTIFDRREGGAVEIFKFNVNHAENSIILGDYDISPNGKWLVVSLPILKTPIFSDKRNRFYIFNRKAPEASSAY